MLDCTDPRPVSDSKAMPANAYSLLAVFILVSVVAGLIAWRVATPANRLGWLLPIVFAFGALYLFGHLLGADVGPMVRLFGFDVALPFDVLLALAAAFVGAAAQRLVSGVRSPV